MPLLCNQVVACQEVCGAIKMILAS
jgi:hypothetical protein